MNILINNMNLSLFILILKITLYIKIEFYIKYKNNHGEG